MLPPGVFECMLPEPLPVYSERFLTIAITIFLPRMLLCISAAYAVAWCLSVRPSRSWTVSKQINISSNFFSTSGSHTISFFSAPSFIFRRGPPGGALNANGVDEKRDSRPISGYGIDDCWSASNNCDGLPCSLPHKRRRISESCLSQPAWTTTTYREGNRTECNCTQR